MTYLVLARKYRPRNFNTLVGQEHVVRALTGALDTQRLHHAWLFTGTRGVGKTTLSRILAKSLNCEKGITSKPCGVCKPCTEIDAGRFIDYLELDAASNRSVDDMTQWLEQAAYLPSAARYKVYMIDEVHMLTGHAFNAMLKTLEEPPPHVKFILATTDPQKIPVTVLSRCLQFNLKKMPADTIVEHLQTILAEEKISCERAALRLIARAANGSMRDALSLTDQAIGYSPESLSETVVREMLGTVDERHLVHLLKALVTDHSASVIEIANDIATHGLSYSSALSDFAILLSRIATEQRIPGSFSLEDSLYHDILHLAASLPADTLQLFYSIAVHSRAELALAPDEYAGFVMTCLRMMALNQTASIENLSNSSSTLPLPACSPTRSNLELPTCSLTSSTVALSDSSCSVSAENASLSLEVSSPKKVLVSLENMSAAQWPGLAVRLPLTGLAAEVARQSEWQGVEGHTITLKIASKTLADSTSQNRLQAALSEHFGLAIRLKIEDGQTGEATAHALAQSERAYLQSQAEKAAASDPFVQSLLSDFGGQILPNSIQPINSALND